MQLFARFSGLGRSFRNFGRRRQGPPGHPTDLGQGVHIDQPADVRRLPDRSAPCRPDRSHRRTAGVPRAEECDASGRGSRPVRSALRTVPGALRITADRTALSKERATAHPDRRGGRWAGIPAKPATARSSARSTAGRTARPRGFGQCRHERPPGQPASGLSQVLPVYVRTTDETDDICIRFSPPLLRRAEIMPEAGLRTLRRTAECSGRGRRAGRTRRSPLSF